MAVLLVLDRHGFGVCLLKYYEMSYGLNMEMHKQTEIAKRMTTICAQIIPFLSQEVSRPLLRPPHRVIQ